jgi:hypothetical protein
MAGLSAFGCEWSSRIGKKAHVEVAKVLLRGRSIKDEGQLFERKWLTRDGVIALAIVVTCSGRMCQHGRLSTYDERKSKC